MKSILEQFKRPLVKILAAGLAGYLLGLMWAWVIQPVQWVNATPEVLRPDLKEDYLRMSIDSFFVNRNQDLAVQHFRALGKKGPEVLVLIQQSPGMQDQGAIKAFGQLMDAVGMLTIPQVNETSDSSNTVKFILISIAGVALLGVLGAIIFFFRPRSRTREATPVMQAQEYTRQAEKTNFETLGLASPITQSMTTYVLGDDLYDESFSIDSPTGEFLGEYGVGISETIGVGDPKKVTALEIWLFDKNDIKTATKVIMSANAFNDMVTRQRLEAKGELVLIEPQKQVVLETATLQLSATVTDIEYGLGPLPQNSYFERATLELAIWPRTG
ncbi:MAG: hypothetical protein MUP03_03185 [Anaerolineales bacterium]|nr:hypothetical protein [Anaerolineales bacterium]